MKMLRTFVVFLASICSVGIALAQTEEDADNRPISPCIFVKSDADRLACYDEESGLKLPPKVVSTRSDWRISSETSALTDDKNVYLRTDSNEPVVCGWSSSGTKASLLVRCQENKTTLYLSTKCHLTSSEYNSYGDITYRIDDLPAQTKGFLESTDNKALGLWGGSASIPFIKQLFGHNKLIMRFTPFSESPITVTFNIAGLEEKIRPLREACSW